MQRKHQAWIAAAVIAAGVALGVGQGALDGVTAQGGMSGATLQVDPFWPKPLPDKWLLGHVIGVAVDSRDHVWVLHRPGSLTDSERGAAADPPTSECCVPAPPVIEFDQEGNVVQAWGGPGAGYEWPNGEHGIFVDHLDNVWIGGNGDGDGQVLKFSRDGTFLLQIGSAGPLGGSDDTTRLGRAADIGVDPEANEVYVADGYGNRRVIVFDADNGEYRRHWGAYGRPPIDGDLAPYDQQADPSPIFGDTVHCVQLSNEGLVYVCDRMNHRLQIFRKDGTFVREGFIGKETAGASTWDVAFSTDPDQTWIYNADGGNHLRGRRQPPALDRAARVAGDARDHRAPRADGRPVRVDALAGRRFGGQRVRGRDSQRPPRAEVHADRPVRAERRPTGAFTRAVAVSGRGGHSACRAEVQPCRHSRDCQ